MSDIPSNTYDEFLLAPLGFDFKIADAEVEQNMSITTHEDHFATTKPEVRRRLESIQAELEKRIPAAERCVSYQMPAYRAGKVFFFFSGFKKHIGIFPPVRRPAELIARLEPYRGPKGNLIFPHNDLLPIDLIGDVVDALYAQSRDD